MSTETLRQLNLPIIAFGTFVNFVDRMRQGLPSRVDRSVVPSLAGGVQGQLIAALAYFDLIDQHGTPTDLFAELVRGGMAEQQQLFRRMVEQHYPFVFNSGLDLARATRHQLEKLFASHGVAGSTLEKAVVFFLAFASEAGLGISSYISGPLNRVRRTKPPTGREVRGRRSSGGDLAILIQNLPAFDLSWSDELKVRWFDSFDHLVELLKCSSTETALVLPVHDSAVRVEVSDQGK